VSLNYNSESSYDTENESNEVHFQYNWACCLIAFLLRELCTNHLKQ